jgi:hypothetical protein
LLRNIDHIAYLQRHKDVPKYDKFIWPVKGPEFSLPPPKALNPEEK